MGDLSKELSELKIDSPLFKDVKYYISGKVHDKALELLQDGGGKRMTYMSDFVTHCITGKDAVENDVSQAEDLYEVPAVTQYWVLLSAKCKKLLPTKGFLHNGGLFSGIKACLSQLSKADNLKIWAMITFRGGVVCDVLDSSCTHLVTAKPAGQKYRVAIHLQQQYCDDEDEESEGQRGKNKIKIVTPDWITDSERSGRRCQETLYHPRLLIVPRPPPVHQSHMSSIIKQEPQLNSPSSNLKSSHLPLSTSSPSSSSLSQITGFAPVGSERNPSPHSGNAPNTSLVYSSPSSTPNTSSSFPVSTSSAMSPSTQANRPHAIPQQQNLLNTKQALEELKQRMPWNKNQAPQQQMQPMQQMQSQQQQQQNQQMQQQMLRQQQLLQQQQQQNFQVIQQRVAAARGMQIRGAIQQQHGISPSGVASPGGQGVPRMIQGQQRVIQGVMQPQMQQQQQVGASWRPRLGNLTIGGLKQQQLQQQFVTREREGMQQTPGGQYTITIQREGAGGPGGQLHQALTWQYQLQQRQLQQQQQQQASPQQSSQPPTSTSQSAPSQVTAQQQLSQQQQLTQQVPQQQQLVQQQQLAQQQQLPQQQQITQQQLVVQQQQMQQQLAQQQRLPQQQQLLQSQQQQLAQQQQLPPQQLQQQQMQQQQPQMSQQQQIQQSQQLSQQQQQQQLPQQQLQVQQQQIPQQQPMTQQQLAQQQFAQQQLAQGQAQQQQPGGQVSWAPQQQLQPQRQVIQLDQATHNQLQQMDPQQRTLFIQKIQKQRLLLHRQLQAQQQQRMGLPPRQIPMGPQQVTVVRPPGQISQQPQQQMVWQQREGAVGPGPNVNVAGGATSTGGVLMTTQGEGVSNAGGVGPQLRVVTQQQQMLVQGPGGVSPVRLAGAQSPVRQQQIVTQGGGTSQQQLLHNLRLHNQQQLACIQQLQMQREAVAAAAAAQQQQQQQVPPGQIPAAQPPQQIAGATEEGTVMVPTSQQTPQQAQQTSPQQPLVNPKTKTALANMLSIRLQSGSTGTTGLPIGQPGALVGDGTAAGQLRLMTAHHQALQQQPPLPPPPPPPPPSVPPTVVQRNTTPPSSLPSPNSASPATTPVSTAISPASSAAPNIQHHQIHRQQQQPQQQIAATSPGHPNPNIPQSPTQTALLTTQQRQELHQQQLLAYQQQRRTLGNISNGGVRPPPPATPGHAGAIQPGHTAIQAPTGAAIGVRVAGAPVVNTVVAGKPGAYTRFGVPKGQGPVVAGPGGNTVAVAGHQQGTPHPAPLRSQYFGHSPSIRLPPGLCLLGFVFLIVDYDPNAKDSDNPATWRKVIRKYGGEVEMTYSPRVTHVLCVTQRNPIVQQALLDGKRCVTAFWLNDVIIKQQVAPPWQALHFPTPYSDQDRPCRKFIISCSGFEGDERTRLKYMIEKVGAKYTGYYTKHNHILICRRAEGLKYKTARNWMKVVVNATWLCEIFLGQNSAIHMASNPKYQPLPPGAMLPSPFFADYSLVPLLMVAWKVPIQITQELYDKFLPGQIAAQRNLKRKLEREASQENKDGPPNKKANLNGTPGEDEEMDEDDMLDPTKTNTPVPEEGCPVIMFTGFQRTKLERKVLQLGGRLAKSCREATHLVTSSAKRTVKFMCCLSTCKYIVKVEWIIDSAAQKKFIDETQYILEDPEMEKLYKFNLKQLLMKPKRTEFFKGTTFFITPGVIPSPSILKEIIECAGGKVEQNLRTMTLKIRGKGSGEDARNARIALSANKNQINQSKRPAVEKDQSTIKKKEGAEESEGDEGNTAVTEEPQPDQPAEEERFECIAVENDLHLLSHLAAFKIKIRNAEYILSSIMKQSNSLESTLMISL